MHIERTETQGLKRQFVVTCPSADIKSHWDTWIGERAKTMVFPGFRKGKAPLSIVEREHGDAALRKIIPDIVQKAYKTILNQNDLTPAHDPDVDVKVAYKPNVDFVFSVSFEVMPDITLQDFSEISLEKLNVNIPDEEIQKILEKMVETHPVYIEIETDHLIASLDIVHLEIEAKFNGSSIEDYAKGKILFTVNVDDSKDEFHHFINENILGKKCGEKISLKYCVPQTYTNESLRGKILDIGIHISLVKNRKYSSLSDEFVKEVFGLDSIELLRNQVFSQTKAYYEDNARLYHKRRLLDALSERYNFECPEYLIDKEFENIWEQLTSHANDIDSVGKTEDELKNEYRGIAERRIRLGLLIGQIAKEEKISVPDKVLHQKLLDHAMRSENPKYVMEHYRQNPSSVSYLRSLLLEDAVIDHLFTKIRFEECSVTVDQLKEKLKDVVPGFEEEETEESLSTGGTPS